MVLLYPYLGGKDKVVRTFPKGISPKVNIIAQLEFELTTMSQFNTLPTMSQELLQNQEKICSILFWTNIQHQRYLSLLQKALIIN